MPFVYPIYCTTCQARQPAKYKIASRWSDGITEELKTYALTCEACLRVAYVRSLEKQKQCRLAPGEILDAPGIYGIAHGRRDDELERFEDLEKAIVQGEE